MGSCQGFAGGNLTHFVLDWETKDYWQDLAIKWLSEGLAMNQDTKKRLYKITNDKSYSQNLRHKALNLLK
jgi:hypothetical protein